MAGAIKQLGLLLWKYVILRKRQPVVLFLELVWPVILFLVVVLVRRGSPPSQVDTCHYPPRSMPTAGFPFLQSFVCNLNNECQNRDPSLGELPKDNNQGMTEFLKALEPMYNDREKTSAALNSMPMTADMLNSIKLTLDRPEVKELLEMKLLVGDLVKDPASVKERMTSQFGVSSASMDAVLGASLNLTKLYELTRGVDFRGIACDPAELGQYLLFSSSQQAADVSRYLCNINSTKIPDLTDFLQSQINVSAIFDLMGRVEGALGEYSDAAMLGDVAALVRLVAGLDTSQGLLPALGQLPDIADWLLRAGNFFLKVQDSAAELNMLSGMLRDLGPYLAVWTGNSSAVGDLSSMVTRVTGLLDWVNGLITNNQTFSMEEIMNMQGDIMKLVTDSLGPELSQVFMQTSLNYTKVMELASMLSNNTDVYTLYCVHPGYSSLVSQLTGLAETAESREIESLLCSVMQQNEEMLSQLNQQYLLTMISSGAAGANLNWTRVLDQGLTMLTDLVQGSSHGDLWGPLTSDLSVLTSLDLQQAWRGVAALAERLEANAATDLDSSVLALLASLLPSLPAPALRALDLSLDLTLDLTLAALDSGHLNDPQTLTSATPDLLCNETTLARLLNLDPGQHDLAGVKDILCRADLAFLAEFFGRRGIEDIEQQLSLISLAASGSLPTDHPLYNRPVNTTAVTHKITALFQRLMDVIENPSSLTNLTESVVAGVTPQYAYSMIGPLVEMLGPVLENSDLSATLMPLIKSINASLAEYIAVMDAAFGSADDSSIYSDLVTFTTEHLTDFMRRLNTALQQPHKRSSLVAMVMQNNSKLCLVDELMNILDLPADLREGSRQVLTLVCDLDLFRLYDELQTRFADVTFMDPSVVLAPHYAVSWPATAHNIEAYVQGLQQQIHLQNQLMNISWSDLAVQMEMFMSIVSEDMDTSVLTAVLTKLLSRLDTSLSAEPRYQQARALMKLYVTATTDIITVMADMLQDPNALVVRVSALWESPSIKAALESAVNATPAVLEALRHAELNPAALLQLALSPNATWAGFCSGPASISGLLWLPRGSAEGVKAALCSLEDPASLVDELTSHPAVSQLYSAVLRLSEPPSEAELALWDGRTVDWTAAAAATTRLVDTVTRLTPDQLPDLAHLLPTVPGMAGIERQWENMMAAVANMSVDNVAKMLSSNQYLSEQLAGMLDNSTKSMLAKMDKLISEQILMVQSIIDTGVFSYRIDSSEISRLTSVLTQLPEVAEVLMYTVLNNTHPDKLPGLLSSLQDPAVQSQLCSDPAAFWGVFLSPPGVGVSGVQTAVCRLRMFNLTLALAQLGAQAGAGQQLMELVSALSDPSIPLGDPAAFNVTSLTSNLMTLTTLMGQLTSFPLVDLGFNLSWTNEQVWTKLLQDYEAGFTRTWQDLFYNKTLVDLFAYGTEPTDFLLDMIIDDEVKGQMGKVSVVMEAFNQKLRDNRGENVSLSALFADSPEARRLVSVLGSAPAVTEVLITSLAQHPQLVMELVTAGSVEGAVAVFCSTARLAVPAHLTLTFSAARHTLCSLNVTALADQLLDELGLNETLLTAAVSVAPQKARLAHLVALMQEATSLLDQQGLQWQGDLGWITSLDTRLASLDWTSMLGFGGDTLVDQLSGGVAPVDTLLNALLPPEVKGQLGKVAVVMEAIMHKLEENQGKNESLSVLFAGSPELVRLVAVAGYQPVLMEVAITSLVRNPNLLSVVLSAPSLDAVVTQLCASPELLTVPDHLSDAFRSAHSQLCSINLTALTEQLLDQLGLNETLVTTLAAVSPDKARFSYLASLLQNTSALLGDQGLQWQGDLGWITNLDTRLASLNWTALLGQHLTDANSILGYISRFSSVLELAKSQPQLAPVLGMLEKVAGFLETVLMAATDLPQLAGEFPELSKLLTALSRSVDLVERVALTTVLDTQQLQLLTVVLGSNPAAVCAQPGLLAGLDLEGTAAALCSLNLTAVLGEAGRLAASLMDVSTVADVASINTTLLLTRLLASIDQISALSLANSSRARPSILDVLDPSAWEAMAARLQELDPPQEPYTYLSYLETMRVLDQTAGLDMDSLTAAYTGIRTADAVIQQILNRLNRVNGSSLEPGSLFPDAPQLQKLAAMATVLPTVTDVLLHSYNTPQFSVLTRSQNFTEVAVAICLGDPLDYFTLPQHVSREYFRSVLISQFCDVDFLALEVEGQKLIETVMVDPSQPMNWTSLINNVEKLDKALTVLFSGPLALSPGSLLANETVWLDVLTRAEERAAATDALAIYSAALGSVLPPSSPVAPALGVYMEASARALHTLLTRLHGNVSLADLLAGHTRLSSILSVSPEALSDLLSAVDPASLLPALLAPQPLEAVCLQLTAANASNHAVQLLCSVNASVAAELTAELTSLTGLDDYLAAMDRYQLSRDLRDLSRSLNDTQLAQLVTEIELMLRSLLANSTFVPPSLDVTRMLTALTAAGDRLGQVEPQTYVVMAATALYATPAWEVFVNYTAAFSALADYTSALLDRLLSSGATLRLSALFSDSAPGWQRLLNDSLGLSQQMALYLTQTEVKVDKLPELLLLSAASLPSALLCDTAALRHYFVFPAEADVDALADTLCSLNSTQLMHEFEQEFQIQALIQKLSSELAAPSPPEALLHKLSALVGRLQTLANTTDVRLHGVSLLNMPLPQFDGWPLVSRPLGRLVTWEDADQANIIEQVVSGLTLLEGMLGNSTWWQEVEASLLTAQYVMHMATGQIEQLPAGSVNVSLRALLGLAGADRLSAYLEDTFSWAPDLVSLVLNNSLDLAVLARLPRSASPELCRLLFAGAPPTTTTSDLARLQCDTNYTAIWQQIQELVDVNAIQKQIMEAVEMQGGSVNWTLLAETIVRLQQTTDKWLVQIMQEEVLPSLPEVLNYGGSVDEWLTRMEKAATFPAQNTTSDYTEIAVQAFATLVTSMAAALPPGPEVSALINMYTALARSLNDRLRTLATRDSAPLNLLHLFNDTLELQTLLRRTLELPEEVLVATVTSPQLLNSLLQYALDPENEAAYAALCLRDLSPLLAGYNSSSVQTALCSANFTAVGRELAGLWDVGALVQQLSADRSAGLTSDPDLASLLGSVRDSAALLQALVTSGPGLLPDGTQRLASVLMGAFTHTYTDWYSVVRLSVDTLLGSLPPGGGDVWFYLVEVVGLFQMQADKLHAMDLTFDKVVSDGTTLAELVGDLITMYPSGFQDIPNTRARQQFFGPLTRHAAESGTFLADVCRPALLETHIPQLPGWYNVTTVSTAVCGQPPSDWYERLVAQPHGHKAVLYIGLELLSMMNSYRDSPVDSAQLNTTASQFSQQLLRLLASVRLLDSGSELPRPSDSLGDSLANIYSNILTNVIVTNLELFDFDLRHLAEFRDFTLGGAALSHVLTFVNAQIEAVTGQSVSVSDVLAVSPAQLEAALTQFLSPDAAAALLNAQLNPSILLDPSAWPALVCNVSAFESLVVLNSSASDLQRELCASGGSGAEVMTLLAQNMQVGRLMEQVEKLLSNGTSGLDAPPWRALVHNVQTFITNINAMLTSPLPGVEGADQWNALFQRLSSLMNGFVEQPDGGLDSAVCGAGLALLRQVGGEVGSQVARSLHMQLAVYSSLTDILDALPELESLLCSLSTRNLTDLAGDVRNSTLFQTVLKLTDVFAGAGTGPCPALSGPAEIAAAVNRSLAELPGVATRALGCVVANATPPAIADVNRLVSLVVEGQALLASTPPLAGLAPGWLGEMDAVLRTVARGLLQQQPVLVRLSSVLNANSSLEQYLLELTELSPELISALLNATLSIDTRSLLTGTPDAALTAALCDPLTLADLVTVPAVTVDYAELSRQLCDRGNLTVTVSQIRSAVNISQLLLQLSEPPAVAVDTAWLSALTSDLVTLLTDVQQLADLAADLADLDIEALASIVPEIQAFLRDGGPDKVFHSIEKLLANIQQYTKDEPGSDAIFNDLLKLSKGIRSLNVLKKYFDLLVPVGSVVRSPEAMKLYLVEELGMSAAAAQAVLNSNLNYIQMVNMTSVDLEGELCTGARLSRLLTFDPNVTVTADSVAMELCAVDNGSLAQLFDFLAAELSIGKLVQQFVTLNADDILKQSNLTAAEVRAAVARFAPLQAGFSALAAANLSVGALPAAAAGLTSRQRATQSMKSLSSLVCGRDDAFQITDEFGLSNTVNDLENNDEAATTSRRRRQASSGGERWYDWQVKEMSKFKTPFCRDVYKDIQRQENGQIIWVFLKPLLMGYIPYAPVTPVTTAIMEEATKVFTQIEDIEAFAMMWVENIDTLQSFINQSSAAVDTVRAALENPLVGQVLGDALGGSAQDFSAQLTALTSVTGVELASLRELAWLVHNVSRCVSTRRLLPYTDPRLMEQRAENLTQTYELLAAVVFEDELGKPMTGELEMPKHVRYTIRMDGENVRPTDRLAQLYWMPGPEDSFGSDLRYLRGFLEMQDMIDNAIITLHANGSRPHPRVTLQQMPYPCHEWDLFATYVSGYFFPVLMTLAWLVVVASSIRNIVYDKEKRLEQTMKVMGLRGGVNWLAWFLNTFLGMLLMSVIITLFLKLGSLMRFSDPVLIFVYLADFSFATTMLCYLVSVFFDRTSLAALVGVLVYLISYIPYVIIVTMETHLLFWHKILICLPCTSAFALAANVISMAEQQAVGVQWHNAHHHFVGDLTFAWTLYMMLIDGAICGLVGFYIRNVFPGKYGAAQPWYFPLSPAYWGCCRKTKAGKRTSYSSYGNDAYDDEKPDKQNGASSATARSNGSHKGAGEPDPDGLPIGISLHHLGKQFGGRAAVRDLSVNLYQHQITALLGQNGAGKTTTINLLTGVLRPTSGSAYIAGHNVLTQFSDVRHQLGVCPQFDVLFDYLTVYEHLDFYASLKSKDGGKKVIRAEIQRMLDITGLRASMHVRVSQLSGGQRRRLSVALAFVGDSRVVILDEPTSGIDPAARRRIWDLIVRMREGRTILLCTHHLDEADMLSDRIIVMHQGELVVAGSPMFLKSEYGSGYHLTMAAAEAGACRAHDVLAFLNTQLPGVRLLEELGAEMTFVLPTDKGQAALFHQLFSSLEQQKAELGVASYGVSDTTLEEVFLKLTLAAEKGEAIDADSVRSRWSTLDDKDSLHSDASTSKVALSDTATASSVDAPLAGKTRLGGAALKLAQFSALLRKRLLHNARDVRSYLSQIVMPCLFICLAMGVSLIQPTPANMPKLTLDMALYPHHSFYRVEQETALGSAMLNSMFSPPYVSTVCMSDDDSGQCGQSPGGHHSPAEAGRDPAPCECRDGRQQCPPHAAGPDVAWFETPSGNKLQNLTGHPLELEDYLIRSFPDYIADRYGGWSFGRAEDETTATVWFNNKGWHAAPAHYSALSNMLLRATAGNRSLDAGEYGITVSNHPLNMTKEQLGDRTFIQGIADTGIAITILCAFCFVPAGYTIYLINEHRNKEKRLQMICGVGPLLYWTTALVWDLMSYLFTVGLATAIAAAFQISIYNARLNLPAFVVILALFGWATIPLMYALIGTFRGDTSTGYMVMFVLNLMLGVLTTACVFLLSLFEYIPEIGEAKRYLSWIFLVFPQFCLGDGLVQLSRNQLLTDVYARFNIDVYKSPFSFEMLGWHFVAMGIEGLVFFVLTLLMDSKPCSCYSYTPEKYVDPKRSAGAKQPGDYREDEDVGLERQRVVTGEARGDLLLLHNLRKVYRRGLSKVQAVDNISLAIPKGECFGLLGVNGAGKTTTFNMLTAEVSPTKGAALLNSNIITDTEGNMQQNVGYCPQFDALDGCLTGREMLSCYARLKGVPGPDRNTVVDAAIQRLGLERFAARPVRGYSGGTKRKLSAAIALLGDPELVLMDEPTTGMDPQTRRLVWANILRVVRDNRSVLLTSHSMAECDALCTRLAVMVNGRLMCLGSGQHLKNRFGRGYTLRLRGGSAGDAAVSRLAALLPGAALVARHRDSLVFQLPAEHSLAHVFRLLESSKEALGVVDYSVSQTTLDQVFLHFASEQTDGVVDGDGRPDDTDVVSTATAAHGNPGYERWGAARLTALPTVHHNDIEVGYTNEAYTDQPADPAADPVVTTAEVTSSSTDGEETGSSRGPPGYANDNTTVIHL